MGLFREDTRADRFRSSATGRRRPPVPARADAEQAGPLHFLVFRLDDRHYGLPLEAVDHAVRAVDVTPLPGAPRLVLGAISVSGRILPVLNVRRRFLAPERAVTLADWFLLAHTSRRPAALVVDEAEGVVRRRPQDISSSPRIAPLPTPFPGVTAYDDGLLLIHDLDLFLGLDDERDLDAALSRLDGRASSSAVDVGSGSAS